MKLYKMEQSALRFPHERILVDALGYRTIKQQVEQYQRSGDRLDAFRAGIYDSDYYQELSHEAQEDMPIDPTRSYAFDFADASAMVSDVRRRMVDDYNQQMLERSKASSKAWADYQSGKTPSPFPSAPPPADSSAGSMTNQSAEASASAPKK